MDRYIPTGRSTKGGLGEVVFCIDQNLERSVVIKYGNQHHRLLDELAALQRIRSKHVVEIFDVVHEHGSARMGIVEEFIDGEDLSSKLGSIKSSDEFVHLLYQLASGLADIYAVGIVHRDIKPSNVLVDTDRILKIIDFNLARLVEDAYTSGFVGTRGYAAPELYAGGHTAFDSKVDVYAMGVMALVLVCGKSIPGWLRKRPPRADKWKATTGGFGALPIDLDDQLVRLLDACLSDDRRLRPSVAEVRNRCGRVLLRGKHRAVFVMANGDVFELHSGNPRVNLRHPTFGKLSIVYDDFDFRVADVEGDIWANNIEASMDTSFPDCCVIAFGGPELPAGQRSFVTMDVSHPEVVL